MPAVSSNSMCTLHITSLNTNDAPKRRLRGDAVTMIATLDHGDSVNVRSIRAANVWRPKRGVAIRRLTDASHFGCSPTVVRYVSSFRGNDIENP